MTQQSYEENLVDEFQPLKFRLIHLNDIAAVYQAVAADYTQPEIPVYTVTLTIAASIQRAAEKELQDFLNNMRARFSPLSAPLPEEDSPDDEQPFDIGTQVGIQLDLVTLKSEELVGATVTLETSIESWPPAPVDTAERERTAERIPDHQIPRGGSEQRYYAYCNYTLKGTVTPSRGSGTIRKKDNSPPKDVRDVGVGKPDFLTAPQIIVRSAYGMTFTISTSFNSHHGKSC